MPELDKDGNPIPGTPPVPPVNDDDGNPPPPEKKVIDPAAYDAVTTDMHKYKAEAKRLQGEAEARNQADNEAEAARLAKANEFKTLYEREKAAREVAEGKVTNLNASVLHSFKLQDIKSAATAAGIRPEAIGDLENLQADEVEVGQTDGGTITVDGAKEFIEKQKTLRPHWFTDSTPPKFNDTKPGTPPAPGTKSIADIGKLKASDPQAYKREIENIMKKTQAKAKR